MNMKVIYPTGDPFIAGNFCFESDEYLPIHSEVEVKGRVGIIKTIRKDGRWICEGEYKKP